MSTSLGLALASSINIYALFLALLNTFLLHRELSQLDLDFADTFHHGFCISLIGLIGQVEGFYDIRQANLVGKSFDFLLNVINCSN